MASGNIELYSMGPFKGLDATTVPFYVDPNNAAYSYNADTNRYTGAVANARGRVNEWLYAGPEGSILTGLFPYDATANDPYYVGVLEAPNNAIDIYVYDGSQGNQFQVQSSFPSNENYFTEAVQFGQTLFLNNGMSISGNFYQDVSPVLHPWQFSAPPNTYSLVAPGGSFTCTTTLAIIIPNNFTSIPVDVTTNNFPNGMHVHISDGTNYVDGYIQNNGANAWTYVVTSSSMAGSTIASGATCTGGLALGTYNYAFTRVYATSPSGFNGYGPSETSALGADYPYPFTYYATAETGISTLALPNVIDGTFSGTSSPDGVPFTTNIYRYSSNNPNFVLLASGVTGNQFVDYYDDYYIAPNAGLVQYRDPPPNTYINLAPIEAHKDRMWSLTVAQNANTNNLPQCIAYYSAEGLPQQFDPVNQVILVGEENTPNSPQEIGNFGSYADVPVRLASVSSLLVCFKRRTTWVIIGDDETTFLARKMFDIGCCSPRSVTKAMGAVFWLSEDGVFRFDGSGGPEYLSENIRSYLEGYSANDLTQAVGAFSNRTFYLSFPTQGVTFAYYTVNNTWRYIPYAMQCAVSTPARATGRPTPACAPFGQLLAARPFTQAVDLWEAAETDLGLPTTTYWTGPMLDSGKPGIEKVYRYIVVEGAFNAGITLELLLTLSGSSLVSTGQVFTIPFTANTNNFRQIIPLNGANGMRGYALTVSFTFYQPTGDPDTFIGSQVYRISVWGTLDRDLVIPS